MFPYWAHFAASFICNGRTPYEHHLLSDIPWVQMEAIVPWDELAKIFFKSMSSDKGRASVDLRLVIGAMLLKHLGAIKHKQMRKQ